MRNLNDSIKWRIEPPSICNLVLLMSTQFNYS